MTITHVAVTFDCEDALAVAEFWSAALDRAVDPDGSAEFASIGYAAADPAQPAWGFTKVPEGKKAKNRVHLDFGAQDRAGEVDRLVGFGATRVDDVTESGMTWTVLQDPEGNEFCVVQLPEQAS
jgi:predicted enzyme related to lactoylglutathione lyase